MRETIRYTIYAGIEHEDAAALAAEALLASLATRGIHGATEIAARGIWNGEEEVSLRVEVIAPHCGGFFLERIIAAAEEYREAYNQAEVWITAERVQLTVVKERNIR